jgi:hypothetical protein
VGSRRIRADQERPHLFDLHEEKLSCWLWGFVPLITTSRSGSGKGAVRKSNTSMRVYMDVLTPIPRARVTRAMIVKEGVLQRVRTAWTKALKVAPGQACLKNARPWPRVPGL